MASVRDAGFNNWLCPLLQVSYVLLRCLFVRWTPLVAVSSAVQTTRCSLRTERLRTDVCQAFCLLAANTAEKVKGRLSLRLP